MNHIEQQTAKAIAQRIKTALSISASNVVAMAASTEVQNQVLRAVEVICGSLKRGGALFVAGNGGSAADAQHFVAELMGRFSVNRPPIRAIALTVDTSILTAVANDFGYDHVFSRQVKGLVQKGDVFLAISTSGNSKNVLEGMKAANENQATSILLSGTHGGLAKLLAHHTILVPGQNTNTIQECHLVAYHTMCSLIEQELS